MSRSPSRSILMLLVAACLGSACAGGDVMTGPSAASTGPTSPETTVAQGDRWLAVIEVAPRADDLDAVTQRVRDSLGEALVVSPVDCYDGLPREVDDGYVIGAVGGSQQQVERLVTEAGEAVSFSASVTILCVD